MKAERDTATITSGVMADNTIGSPIAIQIPNLDHAKWKGKAIEPMTTPRPGHADLTGAIKYGYDDLRMSLERASARETAARVAIGSIGRKFLAQFGIKVGSYVIEIGGVRADVDGIPIEERFHRAADSEMQCPDSAADAAMRARVEAVMRERDTLGGVFEVVALGVPPGLGSHVHWDRRLSARLAQALMSIHAMKGVEIGEAFENAKKKGTEVHDEITLRDGRLSRATNRAGGLEGGITTGEPILLRVAMKPISTTLNPLMSVNLATGKEEATKYERSDFCAVPRAGVIGEAMVCFVLADALMEKLGGDSMEEVKMRFDKIKGLRTEDLKMMNEEQIFWE